MSGGDGSDDPVLRRMVRLQTKLDAITDELHWAVQRLRGRAAAPVRARRDGVGEDSLRAAARLGVAAVSLERQPPVNILRIDAVAIELPDALADLAEQLLDDPGGEPGPLIGWTPTARLRAVLGTRDGRPLTQGALRMQIHKLRERLRHAGQNPHLVQTSRSRGAARFARRRPETGGAAARDG